jgi:hypothetical protein
MVESIEKMEKKLSRLLDARFHVIAATMMLRAC